MLVEWGKSSRMGLNSRRILIRIDTVYITSSTIGCFNTCLTAEYNIDIQHYIYVI